MGYVEDRSANLKCVVAMPRRVWRPDLIHRPGEGLRFGKASCRGPRKPGFSSVQAATAMVLAPAAGLKGWASAGMRCMITASLRASATFALRMPARRAIRMAQLLSCEQPLTALVSMTWAA